MYFLPSLLLCFSFPSQEVLQGQLPKADLGVTAFLAAHPEFDGRGIRVAVLDTGVDPGHPLLQQTSQGGRKLVDWYDATTDGRIQIEHFVAAEKGTLYGLSGRQLTLGQWAKEGREFGLLRLDQDFLPAGLQGRLESSRRKEWQKGSKRYQEARARMESKGVEFDESSLAEKELQRKWDSFADVGPVWDGLVFHDGKEWRVVFDNDEDGNLDEELALRDFTHSGDWATLGDEALLNYAVKVAADGKSMQFFFDAHGHGTHVAGIIGAYEGEGGRLNGIAPGVEIVAIKVGDGKYGGATSGYSIIKALDYAVEAGCQVANLSFGGPSFFADGREPDAWVVEEATRRGLSIVTSAGNEGPTLSTVGAPATTEDAFSIAAAVWPATQQSNYASLNPSAPVLFEFSSRGPLPNGSMGIDFAAPGAALSALPSWGMSLGESWNGTSMAAPQMAGCVALMNCAAQSSQVSVSPARIHRAFRLSAQRLPQHAWIEQGHGFIAMSEAWKFLQELDNLSWDERQFKVATENQFGIGAGIYWRGLPSAGNFEQAVKVVPRFDEEASNAEKANFLRTFELESEASWVEVPAAIYTSSKGQSFPVRLLANGLAPGLHETRILLWDADKPRTLGADVIIPVTVVIPLVAAAEDATVHDSFAMDASSLVRRFFAVPYGATQATIQVTQKGGGRNEYRPGAGSVSGVRYAEDRQKRGRFFLKDGQSHEMTVPVEAGSVLEYALAARWSTNTPALVDLDVKFSGLVAGEDVLNVPVGQGFGYLPVQSLLTTETPRVSGKIFGVAIPVSAPWVIEPDPIRATIMDGKGLFYGLVNWDLKIPADGCGVSLHMPHSLQTMELREDLMLEIKNAAGAIAFRGIAYEVETDLGYFDEGNYTCQLTFPSIGRAPLQAQFAGAELRLAHTSKSLRVSSQLLQAFEGGGSSRFTIPRGGARTVAFEIPELTPVAAGSYWYGKVKFEGAEGTLLEVPVEVHRPLLIQANSVASLNGEKLVAKEASGQPKQPLEPVNPAELTEEMVEEMVPIESAGTTYLQLLADDDAEAQVLVSAARSWAKEEPHSEKAGLAVLQALAKGGSPERGKELARHFLTKFPNAALLLLESAPLWN